MEWKCSAHSSWHDGCRRGTEYGLGPTETFVGNPLSMWFCPLCHQEKCIPTKPPTPNINPKPMNQEEDTEHKVNQILSSGYVGMVFYADKSSFHQSEQPPWRISEHMPAASIQHSDRYNFIDGFVSVFWQEFPIVSCAQGWLGTEIKVLRSSFRIVFPYLFLLVVSIIFFA